MAKSRPMGYIFPKRIQSTIAGDWSKKTFFGSGLTDEDKRIFAEKKEKEQEEKEAKSKVLQESRTPWMCPTCSKIMRNKLDEKYYSRRGMCMNCTISGETWLRTHGLYKQYEEATVLRNYKAYMLDVKEQAEEFLNNLKDEIHVVNHDGTFDKLKSDNTKIREFMILEIEDINKKLVEVEDIDMEVSAEQTLGINLKDIVRDIIKQEKEREESIEQNS